MIQFQCFGEENKKKNSNDNSFEWKSKCRCLLFVNTVIILKKRIIFFWFLYDASVDDDDQEREKVMREKSNSVTTSSSSSLTLWITEIMECRQCCSPLSLKKYRRNIWKTQNAINVFYPCVFLFWLIWIQMYPEKISKFNGKQNPNQIDCINPIS